MKLFLTVTLFCFPLWAANYDFYAANKKSNAPVVIFVHGGAWISGSKDDYKALGESLAKNGFCTAVAGYSLAPVVKHPIQAEELDRIISDVSTLKKKECNTNKIILVGHSAGAHMIAFWNTKYSNSAVKGFVGIEGIYDIVKIVKIWPSYKDWFIVSEFGDSAGWAAASPALLPIKSKAPWLLFHSNKDERVDFAQTEDFKNKLSKEKVAVKLVTLKDENHFGAIEAATGSKEIKMFIGR